MIDLSGRTAIVTGGASGIGRGICLVLAEQGADVVVADLDAARAATVAGEIVAHGRRAQPIPVDVTDRGSVTAMVERALGWAETVDILINNAGVVGAPGWEERENPDDRDWDLVLAVNLRGVVHVSEAVAPHMKARRYGKIVNIASIAGRQGGPQNPPYNVSKAGVISWTQSLALQLAPFDINVNAICPGSLWTPLYERLIRRNVTLGITPAATPEPDSRELFERSAEARIPLRRPQTPEDVGKLAAFLVSDDARNITGQAINLDGGLRLN